MQGLHARKACWKLADIVILDREVLKISESRKVGWQMVYLVGSQVEIFDRRDREDLKIDY